MSSELLAFEPYYYNICERSTDNGRSIRIRLTSNSKSEETIAKLSREISTLKQ
jgi:hypothetical protein